MFQFVHTSDASSGKTAQSRRQVRSQAMRDFRRRQRTERQTGSTPDPNTSFDGQDSTRSPTPYESSGLDGQGSPQFSHADNSSRRVGISSGRRKAQKDFEGQFQVTEPAWETTEPVTSPGTQQTSAIVPTLTTSSHHPLSVLEWQNAPPERSPQPGHGQMLPPGHMRESSAQIEQMFLFCESYLYWLCPGVNADVAAKVMSQAKRVSTCPMLLAGCCLASVGHLDFVQPNPPEGNHEVYKARVLREVNARKMTSDETIGALACLLSFEISRGSCDALTHLHGLRSVLNERRKIQGMDNAYINMMIETLDLLHALMYDQQLVLLDTDSILPASLYAQKHSDELYSFTKLVSLLVVEQENYIQANPTSHTELMRSLGKVLKIASSCLVASIDELGTRHRNQAFHELISEFQLNLKRFGHLCERNQDLPDKGLYNLGWACFYMASIYLDVIVEGSTFRHPDNKPRIDRIIIGIQSTDRGIWRSLPYLRLFLFLTGAIACSEQSVKGYLKAQLIRDIYQMGFQEWRRVRTFIHRLLYTKQALRLHREISNQHRPG